MPEQPQENLINEATKSNEKSREGFEMTAEQAGQITAELSKLNDVITHDKPISIDDLENLSKVASGTKIDVGGEMMTVEDVENNLEIWKQIKKEDILHFPDTNKLTAITAEVVDVLTKLSEKWGRSEIKLNGLTFLSETVALHLGKYQGKVHLNGLTTISDSVANYLSGNTVRIDLDGLKTISEQALEYLVRSKADVSLYGLNFIPESIIKYKAENPNQWSGNSALFKPELMIQIEEYRKQHGKS